MSKQASNKQSLPDPELEAILEADRLALSAFYSDITVKA